jgi:hypothetical protein
MSSIAGLLLDRAHHSFIQIHNYPPSKPRLAHTATGRAGAGPERGGLRSTQTPHPEQSQCLTAMRSGHLLLLVRVAVKLGQRLHWLQCTVQTKWMCPCTYPARTSCPSHWLFGLLPTRSVLGHWAACEMGLVDIACLLGCVPCGHRDSRAYQVLLRGRESMRIITHIAVTDSANTIQSEMYLGVRHEQHYLQNHRRCDVFPYCFGQGGKQRVQSCNIAELRTHCFEPAGHSENTSHGRGHHDPSGQ